MYLLVDISPLTLSVSVVLFTYKNKLFKHTLGLLVFLELPLQDWFGYPDFTAFMPAVLGVAFPCGF